MITKTREQPSKMAIQLCSASITNELLRRELIKDGHNDAAAWLDLSAECLRRAGLKHDRIKDPIPFARRMKNLVKILVGLL